MEATVARGGRRRGRWLVLGLLVIGGAALAAAIVDLSTQEPEPGLVRIDGAGDAQRIFGGVRQSGDRLGDPGAPVSIQLFDDLQCADCRRHFLSTIPPLVEDYVRAGEVKLQYRHYSFSARTEQLGFVGAEAAAEQGYTWPYIYLFFRNQNEAEARGIDEDYLAAIAGSVPELEVPQWREYFDQEGGADGRIGERLAGYEELGRELGIRAEPAAVVNGPGGTQTLQDSPSLAEIEAAIDAVG